MKKICIIDYGAGNIRSLMNSLAAVIDNKTSIEIVSEVKSLAGFDKIILPGVGAFKNAMDKINAIDGMVDQIKYQLLEIKKPFLGICVGMQMLAERGYEVEEVAGLGIIKGDVVKLSNENVKIPHIGWNDIKILKESKILNEINDNEDFYFVHSYYFKITQKENIIASVNYGKNEIPAIIGLRDNIFATQFHPEKSSVAGLKLLKNFVEL